MPFQAVNRDSQFEKFISKIDWAYAVFNPIRAEHPNSGRKSALLTVRQRLPRKSGSRMSVAAREWLSQNSDHSTAL